MLIGISGGKGGTGKSFVSTNLALVLGNYLLADLDVEAPNDHILLGLPLQGEELEVKVFKPEFDREKCVGCGACAEVCSDGAIIIGAGKKPFLIENLCGGCTACQLACPVSAVKDGQKLVGKVFVQETPYGFKLLSGVLKEGEERVFKMVAKSKKFALCRSENVIFDSPAGAGNAVFKVLDGLDVMLAVTEPTPFGQRDLEKIAQIAKMLEIKKAYIILNKAGMASEDGIMEISKRYDIPVIAKIPYSEKAIRSYVEGKPIVLWDVQFRKLFEEIAREVI